MLVPSLFRNNFFDGFMDDFDFPTFSSDFMNVGSAMKTDIKENDNNYEIAIEMPGVSKEDIHAELKHGYLVINAETNKENDEKDENGKYIRRERYSGTMSRSFYVGNKVKESDITARFENGVLKLNMAKPEPQAIETAGNIAIEG